MTICGQPIVIKLVVVGERSETFLKEPHFLVVLNGPVLNPELDEGERSLI